MDAAKIDEQQIEADDEGEDFFDNIFNEVYAMDIDRN
jgi:hypothetical protein